MRAAIGGWVLNKLSTACPRRGLVKNIWAVEVLGCCSALPVLLIFCRALIRPSGYLVVSAPVASARYSRRRLIASWSSEAAMGASMIATIATAAISWLLLSRSLLPPQKEMYQKKSAI